MKMLLIAVAALAQAGAPTPSQDSTPPSAAAHHAMGMAGMTSDEMQRRCAMMAKEAHGKDSATKPMSDTDKKAMHERCAAMMAKAPPTTPTKP